MNEIGWEEIGAVMTKKGPVSIVRTSAKSVLPNPAIVPAIAGTRTGLASTRTALPLGAVAFVNAGAVALQLQQNAQGFMRSRKLVLTRHNIQAAVPLGAPDLQVLITNIRFGAQSVLIGVAGMPVEMFAADAVDNEVVAGIPVSPGLLVTVDLVINAAPGVAEQVLISGALLGDSV